MRGRGGCGIEWKEHAMSATAVVKQMSVEEAIAAYLERLRSLRFGEKTICRRRQFCRELRTFAKRRGTASLTTDLISAFFAQEGVHEEAQGKTMTPRQVELRRTMWALRDFTQHGYLYSRRKVRRIPPGWQTAVGGYLRFATEYRGLAQETLRTREGCVARFSQFLHDHGAPTPPTMTSAQISQFLLSLSHYQGATLSLVSTALRSFLDYLFMSGLVTEKWSDRLSHVRCARPERLPAIWRPEEVEALLQAVDRASPQGKRDFAILLLAARMGMRVCEIRTLRLEHLHWEEARIAFVQSKTGVEKVLPLTEEVGGALVDYLRNGRPQTEHREVFLRCRPPFEPFYRTTNLMNIVTKYRRRAGIHFPPERKSGMHSLRHTVASRLLEVGVGFETIAGILGHTSLRTAQEYTRIDVDALRAVALDPEEVTYD
jgi:site-specific recombinase XerD